MYRVTRTVRVSNNPPRFEAASQPFETLSEAETAYIRACVFESTHRVCLDVSDGASWRPLALFELGGRYAVRVTQGGSK